MTNWHYLFHAYGQATDTPLHLDNLRSPSHALRDKAADHLFGAVLHQGTIYTVTPVAVKYVLFILNDPALREDMHDYRHSQVKKRLSQVNQKLAQAGTSDVIKTSLQRQRTSLEKQLARRHTETTLDMALSFLGEVGLSLSYCKAPTEIPNISPKEIANFFDTTPEDSKEFWWSPMNADLMTLAIHELFGMADNAITALIPFIQDANPIIAKEAINATANWAKSAGSKALTLAADAFNSRLINSTTRDEKASLVLALGQTGADVSVYLDDTDIAIQACAAIFVNTEQATSILIAALREPRNADKWFKDTPGFFQSHIRFVLLEKLLQRDITLEKILPAALAMIAASEMYTSQSDYGPILKLAFPDAVFKPGERPPLPTQLTTEQKAVLEALLANDAVWGVKDGNGKLEKMKVGLPESREEVREYVRTTTKSGVEC